MKHQSKPMKTSTKLLLASAALLLVLLIAVNILLKNFLVG